MICRKAKDAFLLARNYTEETVKGMGAIQGQPGEKGEPGEGVPEGGTVGQVLVKKSDTDYDTEWQTPQSGSGNQDLNNFIADDQIDENTVWSSKKTDMEMQRVTANPVIRKNTVLLNTPQTSEGDIVLPDSINNYDELIFYSDVNHNSIKEGFISSIVIARPEYRFGYSNGWTNTYIMDSSSSDVLRRLVFGFVDEYTIRLTDVAASRLLSIYGVKYEEPAGTDDKKDKEYEKFVVFAVAGQSNAVGYDESLVDIGSKLAYVSRDTNRIKQLGFYGEDNLQIIDLGYCAQSMQDMRVNNRVGEANPGTKGLHLPLANLMLDYIPEDYGVLVLPISYGGTGFTGDKGSGTYSEELKKPTDADPKAGQGGQGTAILKWGTGTAYYQTLRDRIIHALKLNDKNLFAGIIWCQGENDMNDADTHYTKFREMTQGLFDELNAYEGGILKTRTPRGTFDKSIWYNMETVGYWYSQGQCQTIWNNYKAWNGDTYIEIPRDTESNDINGTGTTASIKAKHFGNNAYQKVIAPRVLQKMIDMNTFGKKVNVVEPEVDGGVEDTGGSTYFSNVPVVIDGEKVLEQSDLYTDTSSTVDFTIDDTGKCTLSEDIVTDLYVTKKPHIILGDVSKLDFEVKRSLYWLIIERDKDSDSLLVVGFGTRNTRLVSKIIGTSVEVVSEAPGNLGQNFPVGTRVRVYRNVDSSVSIYYKLPTNNSYVKWFDVEAYGLLPERVFGFACGISSYETTGAYNGELNVLFDNMRIQESTPFPNYQIYDIKISELEDLVSHLATKVTALEQAESP